MPRTRHTHVRVQHDAVIKHNVEVFSVALNAFHRGTHGRVRADQSFGFKSRDGVANERGAQRCCRTVDGVALWHDPSIIRQFTRLWTTDSVMS